MSAFKCKMCGGTLEINKDYATATCEYCGRQSVLTDEMKAYATKLKTDDEQRQQQKQKAQREEHSRKEQIEAKKEEKATAFRKGAFSKILMFLMFWTLAGGITLISEDELLSGILALSGTMFFAFLWLSGMQMIAGKGKRFLVLVAMIAIIAALFLTQGIDNRLVARFKWPDNGIASQLPTPNAWKGTITENTSEMLKAEIDGVSSSEFEQYVGECKARGFTICIEEDFITHFPESSWVDFAAYNSDEYYLMLNDSFSMEIVLIAPKPIKAINWNELIMKDRMATNEWTEGRVLTNTNSELVIQVVDISLAQYMAYCDTFKNSGYDLDVSQSGSEFVGYASDGYSATLSYVDDLSRMQITITATAEMAEFSWPKSGAADLLPKPKSNYGHVYYEHEGSFAVDVGNTSKADYDEYVAECMEEGFSIDYDKYENTYYAKNKKGYSISVKYEGGNVMYISIDDP